ncbi:MAG: type 4a pilus biogenesis protein PilO [Candidatus Firestonebacteria bacterium]
MSKEKQKWILLGLIVGVILYGYFQFLYFPLGKKVIELRNTLDVKKKELENARLNASGYEKLKAEAKQLEMELNFIMKRLPKFDDQPGLIKEVSKAAGEKDVSILSFEFQKVVPGKIFYSEVPIKLSVVCNYHDLGGFLTKLGYSMRLINAYDCQFSGVGSSVKGSVNVSVILKAFVSTKEKEGSIGELEAAEHPIIPMFRYSVNILRDPFKSLNISEAEVVSEDVNISALKLSGIIALSESEIAVFEDSNKSSYFLINNKFYLRDRSLVKNIEGKIEKGKVRLSHLDAVSGAVKEVVFEIK